MPADGIGLVVWQKPKKMQASMCINLRNDATCTLIVMTKVANTLLMRVYTRELKVPWKKYFYTVL